MTLLELAEIICQLAGRRPRLVTDKSKPEGRSVKSANADLLRRVYPGFRRTHRPAGRACAGCSAGIKRHSAKARPEIRGSRLSHRCADAQVVVFNKGGRDFRLNALNRGEEVPREFYYGFFELAQAGLSAAMMSSSGAVPGLAGALADRLERGFAAVTGVGVRPLSMRLAAPALNGARVVISYTDGFSLSLGLGFPRGRNRPILIGGFHGLSDIETHADELGRPVARAVIRRSLAGLDHLFFFGPADRQIAIERYGVAADRSSVIPFGVDTDFWRPLPDEPQQDFVVAIGQDRNRDYDLLAAAPGRHPIRIVTRRHVNIPPGSRLRADDGRRFLQFRFHDRS